MGARVTLNMGPLLGGGVIDDVKLVCEAEVVDERNSAMFGVGAGVVVVVVVVVEVEVVVIGVVEVPKLAMLGMGVVDMIRLAECCVEEAFEFATVGMSSTSVGWLSSGIEAPLVLVEL